jgi:hypothetical protein
MSFFSSFVLSFGAMLVLTAVTAAWLFRTSGAPFPLKIVIPTLLVALACYTPLRVNAIMGFPVTVSFDQLPAQAELVAFVAHDHENQVDLWLRTGDAPRAYETALNAELKRTLRQAREEIAHGRKAMLIKSQALNGDGRSIGSDTLGIGDDRKGYVLELSADELPSKE